jgi:FkbM family methyltransferase
MQLVRRAGPYLRQALRLLWRPLLLLREHRLLTLQHDQLTDQNTQLTDQLREVGRELAEANEQLAEANERIRSLCEPNPDRDVLTERYRARELLFLLPRLLPLLPEDERFTIVDGGAREVDRDPRWRPVPPRRLRFIGFEPDAEEARRLNETPGPGGIEWQFVAAGLWGSTGTQMFEHNKTGGGSSFLRQNRAVTDRWKFENPDQLSLAGDIFYPLRQEPIQVVSLSDWGREARVDSIDFLKLNVQGGELEILRGAGPLLDSVLGILVEVAFVESYHERPMFSDIDAYLRERGFIFFDLLAHHYVGRSSAPLAAQHLMLSEPRLSSLVSSWGQLIEGHALYLRDPLTPGSMASLDTTRVLKLAGLAEIFGQVEYAFELIAALADHLQNGDPATAATLRTLRKQAAEEYARLLRPGAVNFYAPAAEAAQ